MAKVLLLCEYPTLCGGERSMLSTFDTIAQAGFEIVVAAPPRGDLSAELSRREIATVPFDCWDNSGVRLSQDELRDVLSRLIDSQQPDLLHANSLAMGRLSGPVAADRCLPSIAHLRDIVRLSKKAYTDLNCHRRLLAVSQATRHFHMGAGLLDERISVLYNGVDLEAFRPGPSTGYLHQELGLAPNALLVGTLGQIGLRKGTDTLLATASRIAKEHDQVHFLHAGACHSSKDEAIDLESQLQASVNSGPLSDRLHLLGVRRDVPNLLRELSLLFHPARQEPLGRVLLEAAATGVPVVATRVGGTEEIFPPESDAAILTAPEQVEEMTNSVLKLLADDSWHKQISQAARRRATKAFDIQRAAAGLVKHYAEVLQTTWGNL